jgi:hypothetical protein
MAARRPRSAGVETRRLYLSTSRRHLKSQPYRCIRAGRGPGGWVVGACRPSGCCRSRTSATTTCRCWEKADHEPAVHDHLGRCHAGLPCSGRPYPTNGTSCSSATSSQNPANAARVVGRTHGAITLGDGHEKAAARRDASARERRWTTASGRNDLGAGITDGIAAVRLRYRRAVEIWIPFAGRRPSRFLENPKARRRWN